MNKIRKNSLYLKNLHEHYAGREGIKYNHKSSEKESVPVSKGEKFFFPRKKSSQILKFRTSGSKNSRCSSVLKGEQESSTGKTIKQRNIKRWENEFNGAEYKNFKAATTKSFNNLCTARKLSFKFIRNESNSRQEELLKRTKTIFKEYQKQLLISQGERKKLFEENRKLKEIISEYMDSR